MKKARPTKYKPWTKSDVFNLIMAFIINVVLIMGFITLTIYLNGIGRGRVEESFSQYFRHTNASFFYLGLTVVLIFLVLISYLLIEHRDFSKDVQNIYMVFSVIVLTLVIDYFAGRYVNIYFRPLAVGAFLLLLLAEKSTALFTNFVICLIVFLMDTFTNANYGTTAQYSSMIIGFVSGTLGVFLIDKIYSRFKVIVRGIIIIIPIMICLLLLENAPMEWEKLVAGASSGLLSVILFVMFLPFFEWAFNKVTDYKLAELTDHSAPLLRRLIEEAPGTFNHSLVVSNLAEACAIAIGENAILARCVAYYHDIGKLHQPEFFKENQSDGKNYHDDITPELSANIIKSHAKDGADLVKEYRLPKIVGDVCLQHHGTMPILYFYAKAKRYTEGEVNVDTFMYQGPKPQTKIAAIIMICDSSEAAVRAIKDRSEQSIDKVVAKIINERMELGQFDECEITIKELYIIRKTIVNRVSGIYHKRIEYPKIDIDKLKEREDAGDEES